MRAFRSIRRFVRAYLPVIVIVGSVVGSVSFVGANAVAYEKDLACTVTVTLTTATQKETRTNVHGTCEGSDLMLQFARIDGAAPPIGSSYTCKAHAYKMFGSDNTSSVIPDSCKRG